MDTTTQYKLNKYSKKVNDAYKQNNMSKVNEYMQHQFNYINKYAQQQQHGGGSVEDIKELLRQIKENIIRLNEETETFMAYVKDINVKKKEIKELEAENEKLGGTEV